MSFGIKYLAIALSVFFGAGIQNSMAQKTILDENAQVRQVGNFNAINISGAFDIFLSQAEEQALVVSAGDVSLRDLIQTEVKNGTLYIGLKKNNFDWRGNRKMRAYISVVDITKLDLSGYSNVKIEGGLKGNGMEIQISGSSDFEGKLEFDNLKLTSSGSSDFNLSGSAEKLNVNTSGNSDLHAYNLMVDYCDINGSGNSSIEITVNKEMKINVSGGTDVYYKGNGIVKEFAASGKSKLEKKE